MNSITFVSVAILACSLIDSILAGSCCQKEIEYQFLSYNTFEHCEGKDSGNYTLLEQFTRDSQCSEMSLKKDQNNLLLSCSHGSKQTNVNMIKMLASQTTPAGAYLNVDDLSLVTAGPLEGKYVYFRKVTQVTQYSKVCSSVLGQSYTSSKSSTLLITDKLDPNVLISPTGAFELFKKGCTTICQGTSITVGPTQIIKK